MYMISEPELAQHDSAIQTKMLKISGNYYPRLDVHLIWAYLFHYIIHNDLSIYVVCH